MSINIQSRLPKNYDFEVEYKRLQGEAKTKMKGEKTEFPLTADEQRLVVNQKAWKAYLEAAKNNIEALRKQVNDPTNGQPYKDANYFEFFKIVQSDITMLATNLAGGNLAEVIALQNKFSALLKVFASNKTGARVAPQVQQLNVAEEIKKSNALLANYTLIQVPSDGNCAFACVLHLLKKLKPEQKNHVSSFLESFATSWQRTYPHVRKDVEMVKSVMNAATADISADALFALRRLATTFMRAEKSDTLEMALIEANTDADLRARGLLPMDQEKYLRLMSTERTMYADTATLNVMADLLGINLSIINLNSRGNTTKVLETPSRNAPEITLLLANKHYTGAFRTC